MSARNIRRQVLTLKFRWWWWWSVFEKTCETSQKT